MYKRLKLTKEIDVGSDTETYDLVCNNVLFNNSYSNHLSYYLY